MSELARPSNNTVNLKIGSERIKSNYNNVFNQPNQPIRNSAVLDMFNEGRPRARQLTQAQPQPQPQAQQPMRGRNLQPTQPSVRGSQYRAFVAEEVPGYRLLGQTIRAYLDDISDIANESNESNIMANTRVVRLDLAVAMSEKLSNDGLPFSTARGLMRDMNDLYISMSRYITDRRFRYQLIFNLNASTVSSGLFDTDISVKPPRINYYNPDIERPATDDGPAIGSEIYPTNEELINKAREVVQIANYNNINLISESLQEWFFSTYYRTKTRVNKNSSISQYYQQFLDYLISFSSGKITGEVLHFVAADGYERALFRLSTTNRPPEQPAQPAQPAPGPVPSPSDPTAPSQPQPHPDAPRSDGNPSGSTPAAPSAPTQDSNLKEKQTNSKNFLETFAGEDNLASLRLVRDNKFLIVQYIAANGVDKNFDIEYNNKPLSTYRSESPGVVGLLFQIFNNLATNIIQSIGYSIQQPVWFGPESRNNALPTSCIDAIACLHDARYQQQGASGITQNREADLEGILKCHTLIYWATSKLLGEDPGFNFEFEVRNQQDSRQDKILGLSQLSNEGLLAEIKVAELFIGTFNVVNYINPAVSQDTNVIFSEIEYLRNKDIEEKYKSRLLHNFFWSVNNNKINIKKDIPPVSLEAFIIYIQGKFEAFSKESNTERNVQKVADDFTRFAYEYAAELRPNETGRLRYINILISLAQELPSLTIEFEEDDLIKNIIDNRNNLNMPVDMIALLNKIGVSHFVIYK